MKIPVSWLREYVEVGATTLELADRLAIATGEVERISRSGVADVDGNLGLYRVGRVLEAGKHPNADRLQLCTVDVGEKEPRQIVCGAWNFGAGATVVLSEPLEPGTPLADVLPLNDVVLELETTPNRPDLLALYGVAREVAALYDTDLADPPGTDPSRAGDEPVDVSIEDFEGCPRYIGRLFREVRIGASPAWLKARLVSAGMRPISNAVDGTNYVMHALGNPLHVFDFDTLSGG